MTEEVREQFPSRTLTSEKEKKLDLIRQSIESVACSSFDEKAFCSVRRLNE